MTQMHRVSGRATTIVTEGGYKKVYYHNTPVVQWSEDKSEIILRTDGYYTFTTKTRMNQAANQFGLGYQVYQKDHTWYVDYQGETYTFNYSGRVTLRRKDKAGDTAEAQ